MLDNETVTIILTLSEPEAGQLASLLDAAVRADGLQAAAVAVPIFAKLQAAAEAAKQKTADVVSA